MDGEFHLRIDFSGNVKLLRNNSSLPLAYARY